MKSNGNIKTSPYAEKQGFLGLKGSLQWRWEDLKRVKDVVLSYSDIADKVKKIRAKLGTRVLTCKQAADLAKMIAVDDAEYKHNFGDSVIILKANKKGECAQLAGRVKSHNPKDDTFTIIYDNGTTEPKIKAQFVKQSGAKDHHREDVIVASFSRVKDLENFSYVMNTLPVEGQLNVAKR